MRRKTQEPIKISADHAVHALRVLISEGKIASKDVVNALKRREALIADLRQRLAALEEGIVGKIAGERSGRGKRRPRRLSAATRAKYRAQGRYLAAVRRLSKAGRAKARAIREKSGVAAAIAAAKKMVKKGGTA